MKILSTSHLGLTLTVTLAFFGSSQMSSAQTADPSDSLLAQGQYQQAKAYLEPLVDAGGATPQQHLNLAKAYLGLVGLNPANVVAKAQAIVAEQPIPNAPRGMSIRPGVTPLTLDRLQAVFPQNLRQVERLTQVLPVQNQNQIDLVTKALDQFYVLDDLHSADALLAAVAQLVIVRNTWTSIYQHYRWREWSSVCQTPATQLLEFLDPLQIQMAYVYKRLAEGGIKNAARLGQQFSSQWQLMYGTISSFDPSQNVTVGQLINSYIDRQTPKKPILESVRCP